MATDEVEQHALARAVAVEILVHGPQPRASLARRLGVSPATLTRVTRPLVATGVLVEGGAIRTPGRGRSSLPLDVVPDARHFVGVKLTRESIYGVLVDLRAQVLHTEVVAEPSLAVHEVVAAVTDVVNRLRARSTRPVDAVGVTVGGRVDGGETVTDSPFLEWHDVPFRTLLAKEVGEPLLLANDVVGLTMAQQWFGYGRTVADFALLTVGAGVGYGLVIDHRVVPTYVSPVSHLPVDPSGPLCRLGHRGCMSAYLSSGAMCATASEALGRELSYDELLALAEQREPVATRVVSEAARALGLATAVVTSLTGVERIILTGEGVRLAQIAPEALRTGRLAYSAGPLRPIDPVVMPMDFVEWARGAAAVAIQHRFP
ncbi:MAG: ROK family protein [Nocardioides sp.]